MNIKSVVTLGLKIALLTILYLVITVFIGAVLPFDIPQPPEDQMNAVLSGLILVAVVHTLVTAIIILRSRWHGQRLALAVGFSMFGVTTVMSQTEVVYFGSSLGIPLSMLPGLVLPNLVTFAIFAPLAVRILGKHRAVAEDIGPVERAVMPIGQWLLKLATIAFIYAILYFSFGYVIAWSNPELQAMYGGGTDPMFSFYRMIPFQFFRATLWVLFALPVIRMTKGPIWQVAVIVGLLFALPMNIYHAVPNVFMPDPNVRLSHFIETTTSNFIFGLIVTWLIHRRHSSVRDLFGLQHAAPENTPEQVEAVVNR